MSQIQARISRAEDKVAPARGDDGVPLQVRFPDPVDLRNFLAFALRKEAMAGGHAMRDIFLRARRKMDAEQALANDPFAHLLDDPQRQG